VTAGPFELPDLHAQLAKEAAALGSSLDAIAGRVDEADSVDPEVRAAVADSGLASLLVPAQFGGRFERVDALAATVVREQLAGHCAHADSLFAMQGIGSFPITAGGSDAVRKRWLPAVAALESIAALALTEPDVGSDLKAISTVAVPDAGFLILDGRKSFITNAGDADFYCVLAKEGDGYSMVLVPAGTAGLSVCRPHQIIAPHVLGDVILDGVRVPAGNRLGAPGRGFDLTLATLGTFRVSVAGAAIGLAQAALEEAARHAAGRQMFGTSLARLGSVPAALAMSWTEIEMARALAYRAAAAASVDPLASLHLSSLAKVGATEAAGRIVDRAVQIMGRFGLVRGTKIERLYREARPMRIYEGSSEAILDSLARRLVRDVAI